MNTQKLRGFGFSEKEAAVYMALIELGSAVASAVAKKARINRSTTYVILDTLTERGLIGSSERRGVKLYSATSPEKLVSYLDGVSKEYGSMASEAKKLLPELKRLHKPQKEEEKHPRVQVFQGQKGMQSVYEDTLSSLESIRAYASTEQKGKKDVRAEVIIPSTREARREVGNRKEEAKESLHLPAGAHGFTSEVNIYDDKVIFISPSEDFGVVIESKEVAKTLRNALSIGRRQSKKGGLSGNPRAAHA